ncbi:hypothetical protein [Streptomyces sp. NPDC048623]|uniref:hypothetical protein n=1 Tax=Streptomyces sp. NPDC048623 TaxID=3155761 RepID=UPI00342FCD36
MDLQFQFMGRGTALAVEYQIDRAGVVSDEKPTGAVESGQMARNRLHDDPPAVGLRDVPDQLVEIEGIREWHGSDEAFAFLLGLKTQTVGAQLAI